MTTNDPAEALRLKTVTAHWALRQARAQAILALLGLGYLAAASLGGVLAVFYFLRHLFNPGDISAGDALSFAFLFFCFLLIVALVFGIVTLAGFPFMHMLGGSINACLRLRHKVKTRNVPVCIAAPFTPLFRWRDGQRPWLVLGVLIAAVYGVLMYPWSRPGVMNFIPIVTTGVFLSYIAFGEFERVAPNRLSAASRGRFEVWMRQRPAWFIRLSIALVLICISTFLSGVVFQDAAWRAMGVRKQNVGVRLTKDDFKTVLAYASRNGIVVNQCEQIGDDTVIRNIDVMSHNFGTKALLIFPALLDATETRARPTVRLEPESDDIEVIRETNQGSCQEFGSDRLFAAGALVLSDPGRALLAGQFASLKEEREGVKVRVVAHRDKTDKPHAASGKSMAQQQADSVKGKPGASGKSMTQHQADGVKMMLQNTFGLKAAAIESVGEEDAVPKRECTDKLNTTERRACEKMNRRVEISVTREH